jgi:tetratricopeptide (TPR) repeat protein
VNPDSANHNSATDDTRDSNLPELLAQFDEALKGTLSESDSATNATHPLNSDYPDSQDGIDLQRAMKCVRLLEDVFPRRPLIASQTATLGRFQIQRELGHGGFGVVYLAHDPQLGRAIALKIPHAHSLADPDTLARFRREAQAAAGLDHPNLVPVYEAGEFDGVNYIALAYCPGTSLAQWLSTRTQPVSPREAASLVCALADAVHYAHERGIVHRDLKPANILLVNENPSSSSLSAWRPKITDFGLAKDLDAAATYTQAGTLAGTPNYMAPEQAGDRSGSVGPATDVYALGAILYELLTGRAPFKGNSALETLHQVRFVDPLPPSRLRDRLNRDLETICLKCLEKEPARRYASARALATDLDAYLEDLPIDARPITRAQRAVRWCRRKPVVAGLAGALALAVLGSAGLFAWHRHRDAKQQQQILKSSAQAAQAGAKADALYQHNWVAVENLMELSQDLLRRPRLNAAGRAVLEELVGSYQRFAQEKSDDRAVRLRSARALLRVANLCGALGQYDKTDDALKQAGEILRQLVESDSSDVPARRELVHFLLDQAHNQRRKSSKADFSRAVETFERALAEVDPLLARAPINSPDLMTRWNILDSLGRTLLLLGEVDRAETALKQAAEIQQRLLAATPDSPSHRAALAAAYEALSQVEQARRRFTQAKEWCEKSLAVVEQLAEERPAEPSHQFALAWTHGRLAEISWAMRKPDDTQTHVTEAVRLLDTLHAASPGDHNTSSNLARFLQLSAEHYTQTGKLPQAREALLKVLTIRGTLANESSGDLTIKRDVAYSCYLLACVFKAQGDFASANGAFGQCIILHQALPDYFPDDLAYRNEIAWRTRDIANQFREMRGIARAETAYRLALVHFARLAAAKPDDPDPLRQQADTRQLLGQMHLDAKSFEAAQDDFEHAIALRERLASAENVRPEDRSELSRHRRSLADTFLRQGRALWDTGQESRAESAFRSACRADESYPEAQSHLAWFLATCADPVLRGHAQARDLAQRAADAAPKAAHMYTTLAAAHLRNNDYAATIAATEQAIRVRGHGRGEDWFVRAMAHAHLNQTQDARGDYDKAVDWMRKNAPGDPDLQRLHAEARQLLEGK